MSWELEEPRPTLVGPFRVCVRTAGSSMVPSRRPGAPHLARFSRDVGYSQMSTVSAPDESRAKGRSSGIPHLAKNVRDVGHPAFVRELEVASDADSKPLREFAPSSIGGTCGFFRALQPPLAACQARSLDAVRGPQLINRLGQIITHRALRQMQIHRNLGP